MKIKIDGKPVKIHSVAKSYPLSWVRVTVCNSDGIPTSEHDIPRIPGKFFCNGHAYEVQNASSVDSQK